MLILSGILFTLAMQLTRFTNAFKRLETPFYFYDLDILDQTLRLYTKLIRKYGYHAHFAMKANANPQILEIIHRAGLGADCVSGMKFSWHWILVLTRILLCLQGLAKQTRRSVRPCREVYFHSTVNRFRKFG